MKVNLVPVLQVVQSLKTDGDLRVQQEVEQTLAILNAPDGAGDREERTGRDAAASRPVGVVS